MVVYGLIPARSGSKRVPGKNTRELGGHPLLAYTIAAARDSGVFDEILVSSDSASTLALAERYGALCFFQGDVHQDGSTDYDWIAPIVRLSCPLMDAFAILRPTSPFRLGSTIARAWAIFQTAHADSLRAVRSAREHPGKMWVNRNGRLLPLLPFVEEHPELGRDYPWHSMPTQALPKVYVQTSALEFAWTARTIDRGTIAGEVVAPFEMDSLEALSIDTEDDWRVAEHLMAAPIIPRPDPSRYWQPSAVGLSRQNASTVSQR